MNRLIAKGRLLLFVFRCLWHYQAEKNGSTALLQTALWPSEMRDFGRGFFDMQRAGMKAGLYTRVFTHDPHTLQMQLETPRTYANQRGWEIALQAEVS